MKTVLCTLYNSLYLDKGLVLFDSLKDCCTDFVLYVLCMDEKCYEVLSDIGETRLKPIRLKDFEDEELLKAKQSRSFGEYCWTCTPSIILYILNHFKEPICTYIDADMFFYRNPQILVDDMISAEKSVMIVPHRFTKVNKNLERNGIYCVEFNTFTNDSNSLDVLIDWRNDCLNSCTAINDTNHFGDQKYLDDWPKKYDCVYVCPHYGAGVAPWNIQSYKLNKEKDKPHKLLVRDSKEIVDLIFYHFQHIVYQNESVVKLNVYSNNFVIDEKLVNKLYLDYLIKIRNKKQYLKAVYNLLEIQKSHITDVRTSQPSFINKLKSFSFDEIISKLMVIYNRKRDVLRIPD